MAAGAPRPARSGRIVDRRPAVLDWPVSGVLTDRARLLAVLAVVAVLAPRGAGVAGERGTGTAGRSWLAGSIAWCVVALALFAPSLATITPGLPNDHYHSFLDPLVLALVGAGLARLAGVARPAGAGGDAVAAGRYLAAAIGIALVAVSRRRVAPAVSPDGGWRARRPGGRANDRRRAAASRIAPRRDPRVQERQRDAVPAGAPRGDVAR